ncbi:MAG: hypothetical protein CMJ75_13465 [Planctomycetaceae bacterium]|nr:hypothetical protein [Planctomycetaceae bacterium]
MVRKPRTIDSSPRRRGCVRRSYHRRVLTVPLLLLVSVAASHLCGAEQPVSFADVEKRYQQHIQPLLSSHCGGCHSTQKKKGELDLQQFTGLDEVRRAPATWQQVAHMVQRGEMPPSDSKPLAPAQRKRLLSWLRDYLQREARASAGDPGPVVLRRLNNAEYTYTIRDLLNVRLDPAREFPADGAAGEGFTNAGGALSMSPALLQKYLGAGKELAQHAVLLPDGFRFSAETTRRGWTDEILTEIRQFYAAFAESVDLGDGLAVGYHTGHTDTRLGQAGRLPLARYFTALLQQRNALLRQATTLESIAADHRLNLRYLGLLWSHLTATEPSLLLDPLRARWHTAKATDVATLVDHVTTWQKGLWSYNPIGLRGRRGSTRRWLEPVVPISTSQAFRWPVLAKQESNKDSQKRYTLTLRVTDAGDGNEQDFLIWQKPRFVKNGETDILLRDLRELAEAAGLEDGSPWGIDPELFGKHPRDIPIDDASLCVQAPSVLTFALPLQLVAGRHLVTTARVAEHPQQRGSVQVEITTAAVKPSTGLLPSIVSTHHSTVTQVFSEKRTLQMQRPILVAENSPQRALFETEMQLFRQLFPSALCYPQIVPVDELHTTTLFYREDDHLTRLMLDDRQQKRLERLWQQLHYVSQSPLMRQVVLEDLLTAMSGTMQDKQSQYHGLLPIRETVETSAARFRQDLVDSEASHLNALLDFYARAYRRPLTAGETNATRALYQQLRNRGLTHDAAFRLTLARLFVATPFLFRLEKPAPGKDAAAVSPWELASRLSYFLWSSQPDAVLTSRAGDASLLTDQGLLQETQRMLADRRVRRLATEFGCQWLGIYEFDQNNGKDEQRFPQFVALRGEMYEEAIRFLESLFLSNGSILELLKADYTFLNGPLAAHYGVAGVRGTEMRRVTGVQKYGRGGILSLGAILASQSGAARTSPVLRGNWIYESLLGERLPRPPAEVPQLPTRVPAGLTTRQLVERHTADPACAKCHDRIDPLGFALEQYDPLGALRAEPADTRAELPDGTAIDGLSGLRTYLATTRKRDFVRQFCRNLLGYALGRAVQLSDEPLLDRIQEQLEIQNFHVHTALEMIVLSQQFRQIRGEEVAQP